MQRPDIPLTADSVCNATQKVFVYKHHNICNLMLLAECTCGRTFIYQPSETSQIKTRLIVTNMSVEKSITNRMLTTGELVDKKTGDV